MDSGLEFSGRRSSKAGWPQQRVAACHLSLSKPVEDGEAFRTIKHAAEQKAEGRRQMGWLKSTLAGPAISSC